MASDALHPAGIYNDVEIIDHGWDKSKEKGTLFLWIKLQSEHGTLYSRNYLTANTADRFCRMLTDIGYTNSSLKAPELADGTALRGLLCQVTVEHEEYDGKTRPVVKWINANNSTGGATRLSGGEIEQSLDAFDILFRKATGAKPEEDEIPF